MTMVTAPDVFARTVPEGSPSRLAEQITGRTYLSHSQLSTMRSCPRKFAFLYVEKAPADFIPSSLIFGGAIHSALELYFRARLEGLEVSNGALLSAYHDGWTRQLRDAGQDIPVRFNKDQDGDSLDALADRIITSFLASPLANPKGAILGVEEELRVQLDPELPDLLARVDLVTRTDGALHVVDFKTSRSRWTQQKAEESAEQLLLYHAAVSGMSEHLGVPVNLHFAIITKAKKPVIQLIPVAADEDRIAGLKESVSQIWQAIQAGNFYPSPSPQNCATCPYRSRCPVFARQ
ncbi:MAG: PD-(D/E)XK nuclease family protein [Tepidisphaeraceae bacterium]|jgi:putative RecB family exonuclease